MSNEKLIEESVKGLEVKFGAFKKLQEQGIFDEELALALFQNEIKVSLLQTVAGLYDLIINHHLISAYAGFCELKPNKSIRDFYDNMLTLNVGVMRMVKEGESKAQTVAEIVKFDSEYVKEWYKNCKDFSSFYNDILSFTGTATVMSEKADTSRYSKVYFKNLSKNLASMSNALHRASTKVDCLTNRSGDTEAENSFNIVYGFFMESLENINLLLEQFKLKLISESKLAEAIADKPAEIDKSKIYRTSAVDEKNNERLMAIRTANMMFDELCNGTMRDLEKQVPYSVREMYDYFVNVKFANFVKNFSMPLDDSAKLSVALEAARQIQELNNYVSRISENATTTNIYMFKE